MDASENTPQEPLFRVLDSAPDHFVFGSWQDVNISIWLRQATGPAVTRLDRVVDSMVAKHPAGISSVQLVANGAAVPTAEARSGFLRIMKRYANDLACVAIHLGGSGFWASTMSSFITGMRLVSPLSFGFRIYSDIADIADWLPEKHVKKTSVRIEREQFAKMLTEVCRDFLQK